MLAVKGFNDQILQCFASKNSESLSSFVTLLLKMAIQH